MTIETISDAAYADLAPLVRANQEAMRNGPNPRDLSTHPYPFPHIGNKEAGAVEQYEIRRDMPAEFGAYLSSDGKSVTVWTGDVLGYVVGRVSRWRDNFGGEREAGRFMMRGKTYSWRGQGNGMFCRCKLLKGSR